MLWKNTAQLPLMKKLASKSRGRKERENEEVVLGPDAIKLVQSIETDKIQPALELNKQLSDLNDDNDAIDGFVDKVIEKRRKEDEQRHIKPKTTRDEILKKYRVRKRYMKKFKLPSLLYGAEIIEKIQPHLPVVTDILTGRLNSPFYYEAKQIFQKSSKPFLSVEEFRSLDLNNFLAGFYGFKRQMKVGEEILSKYSSDLKKSKSPTLQWWGAEDFANYVLAPEVLVSLCIAEMKLPKKNGTMEKSRLKVHDLFEDTVEYGIEVADSDPLEAWEVPTEVDQLKELGLDPQKYGSSMWHHTIE